jgi:hypothetical protein
MTRKEKKRKPYQAPRIEVSSHPVLTVHAAITQTSAGQLATQLASTSQTFASSQLAQSSQWLATIIRP